jgi:hypothetical protein
LKLKRQDPVECDYLEALEESYYTLSKSAQVLTHFKAVLAGVRRADATCQDPDKQ